MRNSAQVFEQIPKLVIAGITEGLEETILRILPREQCLQRNRDLQARLLETSESADNAEPTECAAILRQILSELYSDRTLDARALELIHQILQNQSDAAMNWTRLWTALTKRQLCVVSIYIAEDNSTRQICS